MSRFNAIAVLTMSSVTTIVDAFFTDAEDASHQLREDPDTPFVTPLKSPPQRLSRIIFILLHSAALFTQHFPVLPCERLVVEVKRWQFLHANACF